MEPIARVRLHIVEITPSGDYIADMFSVGDNPVPPTNPPPTNGQDQIDLHTCVIASSPSDIADWPITRAINAIHMRPDIGLTFDFDQPLPDSWKYYTGNGDDNYQYTVWTAAYSNGVITAAAFIQMWQGRNGTGTMDPTPPRNWPTHFHQNWAYSSRWGNLNTYIPQVGDKMAFLVSAGNARDQSGPTSVKERSNVVVITIPSNSTGDWTF